MYSDNEKRVIRRIKAVYIFFLTKKTQSNKWGEEEEGE
jgi:hypothetical protein